jgi:hypothetical protein
VTYRALVAAGVIQSRRHVRLTILGGNWHPDDDGDPAPTPQPDEDELPTAA